MVLVCAIDFNFCFYENSAKATEEYELARKKIASFINASDSSEIIFTRNATEAINLVAYSWGPQNLKPEDEVDFSLFLPHIYIFSFYSFCTSDSTCFCITFMNSE